MRDSRVELPLSVPRGQFIVDMEYFGLDYVDANITLSVSNPLDLFHSLGQYRDYFQEKSVEINDRYHKLATEKLACEVAQEYFSQLRPDDITKGINFFCPAAISVKLPQGHSHGFRVEDIQEHLEVVGLKAERMIYGRSHSSTRSNDEVSVVVSLL